MVTKQKIRGYSAIDVIDRVLDKGIVIDAMANVSVLGLDHVVDIDARVVVASIDTYVQYAEPISRSGAVARPKRMKTRRTEDRRSGTSPSATHQGQERLSGKFSEQDQIRARGLSVYLAPR